MEWNDKPEDEEAPKVKGEGDNEPTGDEEEAPAAGGGDTPPEEEKSE